MSRPAYRYAHQQQRKAAMARLADGTPCPICGRPMFRWQRLHYDHVTPVVVGGGTGERRIVHARCNESRGGRLGRARQLASTRTQPRQQKYDRWLGIMHHEGAVHDDAKRDAIACIRAVLAEDWQAIGVILDSTPCHPCLIEAIAYLAILLATEDEDITECEHGGILIDPGALEAIDADLAELQDDLARQTGR